MFNIIFSDNSILDMEGFTLFLKSYYIDFYNNTGIYSEKEIIESYIKNTDLLFGDLVDNISKIAKNGLIGRTILKKLEEYEICRNYFSIRSYLVVFESKIIFNENLVVIEKVKFMRG
ncbi:MAG: hypothetical protein PHO80_04550 [Candidatus Gracilibacteria bacterium]|nr:hypothetical protein [Candidatus Gracilibacteria bacterium]